MAKAIRKSTAFLSAAVMVMAMLLYFPGETFRNIDWGLTASAAEITPSQPNVGDGSEGNPYQIGTKEELYWFAALVNGDTTVSDVTAANTAACAKLTDNITVNEDVLKSDGTPNGTDFISWTPIGNNSNNYAGTFDGQGFTVSGLYCNDSSANRGLFGIVKGGSISYVGVVDSYFKGDSHVGGVCGKNDSGTIENCFNTGTVIGLNYVGGVCGWNYISGSDGTAEIKNCYNTGAVTATNSSAYVGGVCGQNYIYNSNGTAKIENCYNTGTVTANGSNAYIGGVCGKNTAASSGTATITSCYNTGTVIGSGSVGGVCGDNSGTISSCYFLSDTATNGVGGGSDAETVESKDSDYFSSGDPCTALGYHPYKNGICTVCGGYQPATDENNVYQIGNAGQLYWFAALVNGDTTVSDVTAANTAACAKLTDNITVNEDVLKSDGTPNDTDFISWTPIGNNSNNYTGTFDGQGFTVSGLYYNSSTDYVGLFGYSQGTIKNVSVVDSYICGNEYVGGVCGHNNSGLEKTPTITNCYNSGTVIGTKAVGGVCGSNVAKNSKTAKITNCYNTGKVSGGSYVGGVCGGNNAYTSGIAEITNCYNTGTVSGTGNYVGGVYGNNYDGKVENCYYLTDTATDDGGKTEAQFRSGEVCYLLNGSTSSDSLAWGQKIDEDNYPVLGVTSENTVYATTVCVTYNNSGASQKSHNFSTTDDKHTCSDCGLDEYHYGGTATCQNKAVCTACGNSYGNLENHTYNDSGVCTVCSYVCQHQSGFTNNGNGTHICNICNMSQSHSFVYSDDSQHKCEDCGSTAVHSGGEATCQKQAVCEACNTKYGELANHSFVNGVCEWCKTSDVCQHVADYAVRSNVIDPTCTSYGSYTRTTYCKNCGEAYKVEMITTDPIDHDYSSGGICKVCGALKNGRDGFKSASLTLTDGVILNYYLILSDEALADTNAYIHFTSPQGLDKKIMLSEGVKDGERYVFGLELRPDQMADEITAQVVYTDSTVGSSINYSVQKYTESVSETDSIRALADAMLKFGAFSQLYTGRNTDNPAADVPDYTVNASIGDEYKHQLSSNLSGISVKGATLEIGAYTTIRVKYQLANGANIEDFTFKCGDTVLTPEKSGDYYYVYLKNIRPQNLDEMYSFTVSDGTNTTTLKYSAFSYMKNILDNPTAYNKNIVNLMNAMYDYNKAAEAYIG